jgi:hypothetical protein
VTKPSAEQLGQMTLAIEALFCRDDILEIAEELRDTIPVGLLDQFSSASDEADRGAARLRAMLGGQSGGGMPADFPAWIRIGIIEALVTWLGDKARTCMHNPQPDRPQPILAAAWKPGLVVCKQCTHLLPFVRNSVADRTCDGCGHLCAGAEHDDPIYPSTVRFGVLTYMFGICENCKSDVSGLVIA